MSIAILKLSRKSVTDIIEKIRMIIGTMTGNANFPTPFPKLDDIGKDVDDLELKYQDAINGGKLKKQLVETALLVVLNDAKALLAYIQSASMGKEDIILSAGVDVKAPRTPIGILPFPTNFRAVFGKHTGEIQLRWKGVKGRVAYPLQINDTPGDDSKWVDLAMPTKQGYLVVNLVSMKTYSFRVATKSTKGTGQWSASISHRAF